MLRTILLSIILFTGKPRVLLSKLTVLQLTFPYWRLFLLYWTFLYCCCSCYTAVTNFLCRWSVGKDLMVLFLFGWGRALLLCCCPPLFSIQHGGRTIIDRYVVCIPLSSTAEYTREPSCVFALLLVLRQLQGNFCTTVKTMS